MTRMVRALPPCPCCLRGVVVPVVFGLPDQTLLEAAERDEVILGGCLPSLVDRVIGCVDCKSTGVLRGGRFIPIREAERIASGEDVGTDIVFRRSDLLRLNEAPSLKYLEEMCEDHCLDGPLTITPNPARFGPGVGLSYASGWYDQYQYEHDLFYPFTNSYFWSVIGDLGDLARFDMEVTGLAETIEAVEGFKARVDAQPMSLPGTRWTALSLPIHDLPTYSYKRPMAGVFTVRDWRTKRFDRTCPGFSAEVVVVHDDGMEEVAGDRVKLAKLRGVRPRPRRQSTVHC